MMAKECEEKKARTIKLLEKAQASYEKQANKLRKHIKFEVGDLVQLNKRDFKMPETLVSRSIPICESLENHLQTPPQCVYFVASNDIGSPPNLPCVQVEAYS